MTGRKMQRTKQETTKRERNIPRLRGTNLKSKIWHLLLRSVLSPHWRAIMRFAQALPNKTRPQFRSLSVILSLAPPHKKFKKEKQRQTFMSRIDLYCHVAVSALIAVLSRGKRFWSDDWDQLLRALIRSVWTVNRAMHWGNRFWSDDWDQLPTCVGQERAKLWTEPCIEYWRMTSPLLTNPI
jgi:hypothetical protein